MNCAFEVCDVRVCCRSKVVVGPVTFAVERGSTVGLCGPSGVGKSTILRALVDLLPGELVRTGEIRFLGSDVRAGEGNHGLRAQAVLVPQSPVVFPGSVLENALFGLRHVVRARPQVLRERAQAALREAGLWTEVCDRLDVPASTLSVGQRQRLCLARALALDPVVLLLDEPTSALDANSREVVEQSIQRLRRTRTVLLVSHDPDQLRDLCDQTLELAGVSSGNDAAASKVCLVR